MKHMSGLLTDFYELTMMQGYFLSRKNPPVIFDMFYRKQPFESGFAVFAGLEPLLEALSQLKFTEDDLDFLRRQGSFKEEFIRYLKDFRFRGDVYAMDEGSIVFPNEPLIRVHANLMEAQLIESLLLNIVNFQTLIASKAARIYCASKGGKILEFGLRRAQGLDGALSATRAAYIGGALATSNTQAGRLLGIPVKGTMAHSWIMAFADEKEAFRQFAELYPESAILLIDTYDTLKYGLKNAIEVGKELKKKGKSIGVRLDSGDLQYLSMKVRSELDKAGLNDATITASNELNEEIIHQLVSDNAPIDSWGVGTHLVTGGKNSSLTGVYKLVAKMEAEEFRPVIKVSNNPSKTTNPGVKQVYRFFRDGDRPLADLISLEEEEIEKGRSYIFYHPSIDGSFFHLENYDNVTPLLSNKMKDGKIVTELPPLSEIREKSIGSLNRLDGTYKRIINPHIYKISLSATLKDLKTKLLSKYSEETSY